MIVHIIHIICGPAKRGVEAINDVETRLGLPTRFTLYTAWNLWALVGAVAVVTVAYLLGTAILLCRAPR